MMDVALISVPHTGTIFTVYLFIDLGFDNLGLNHPPVERDCIYHGHALKPTQISDAIAWANKGTPLVIPMRHPYLTEEAWKRRGKDIDEMIKAYRNLMEHIIPLDPYIMPVDSPKREQCLDNMREGLGLPFETDWSPKHVFQNTHALNRKDLSPSDGVRQLCHDMSPILSEYYEGHRMETGSAGEPPWVENFDRGNGAGPNFP